MDTLPILLVLLVATSGGLHAMRIARSRRDTSKRVGHRITSVISSRTVPLRSTNIPGPMTKPAQSVGASPAGNPTLSAATTTATSKSTPFIGDVLEPCIVRSALICYLCPPSTCVWLTTSGETPADGDRGPASLTEVVR